jgi:hypothetical protein
MVNKDHEKYSNEGPQGIAAETPHIFPIPLLN